MASWSNWYTNTMASAWTGTIRPDPSKKILGTSFTYQPDGRILEEVQQVDAIYQRYFNDNYTNFTNWAVTTTPTNQTLDLGI